MKQFTTTKQYSQEQTVEHRLPPPPPPKPQQLDPLAGAIPVEEAGLLPPSQSEDTISMRLEAEKFKFRIWRTLAGYVHKEIDGHDYLVPSTHFRGVVSAQAAFTLCQQTEYWVNQIVGLGHTSYDEALLLWGDAIDSIMMTLAVEDDFQDMTRAQKHSVMSGFKTVLWHQATRAVDGREAKNLITRIEESRGEQNITEKLSTGKGFSFPGAQKAGVQ